MTPWAATRNRWLGIACALAACGGDAGDREGTPDGSADGATAPPVEVAPAAEPVWSTCPAGWRAAGAGGWGCEPWPEGGPSDCAPGEAHFPGGEGCEPIGSPCPVGEWPEGLPSDRRILYVHPDAATAGDGTQAQPFDSIARAMRNASAETIVALARGVYEEVVHLRTGVTLWGTCARDTVIRWPVYDGLEGTVNVAGAGAALRDLRIEGERPGLWLDSTSASLEGVQVHGVRYLAVVVSFGAELTGRRVVVDGTRPRQDGTFGYGLMVAEGGRLALSQLLVDRNHGLGVAVGDPESSAELTDAAVRRTGSHAGGRFGNGIGVSDGAALRLSRAVVEDNLECAITAHEPGTTAILEDVVVRGTLPREVDGQLGCGLAARDSTVEVSRALFADNHYTAVAGHRPGTRLVLRDVVIEGTRQTDSGSGVGLFVEAGASASLERARLSGNRVQAVLARGEGTELHLLDVALRDTESDEESRDFGRGLEVNGGATVIGERVTVSNNRDAGLAAFDAGSRITLSDVLVEDTRERACVADLCAGYGAGVGAVVALGGAIELAEFAIRGSALSGVHLVEGEVDLRRGEIAHNPIGVSLQIVDYDVERLSDGVVYRDNERNLERTSFPPPDRGILPPAE